MPYFESTGAPYFVDNGVGGIVGLKVNTRRGEILKAIMEGITFYFLEPISVLKTLNIDTSMLIATGGGAKSDKWLQIQADILGIPFMRPKIIECGTLGCAILAGCATQIFKDIKQAVDLFVRTDRVFTPNMNHHQIYQEQYIKYKQLLRSIMKVF